jgi:uncharacterized Rmd1/YagE family protein
MEAYKMASAFRIQNLYPFFKVSKKWIKGSLLRCQMIKMEAYKRASAFRIQNLDPFCKGSKKWIKGSLLRCQMRKNVFNAEKNSDVISWMAFEKKG